MRRTTSKRVSGTVVAGLVLASLTVAGVGHASPRSVAEPGSAAPLGVETVWTGTISTTWTFVSAFNGALPGDGHVIYKTTGSATYGEITSIGGRNYSARTAIGGTETINTDNGAGVTCDHTTPFERTAFIDPEANEGVAPVMLDTEPDGTVLFTPGGIQITGVINSYECSDGQAASGPTNTFQGTLLHGLQAAGALTHDTDPDPARLVGTMHWTKGNPPHPLPPDTDGHTTEYDFTATYDLTGTQTAIVAVDRTGLGGRIHTSTGSAPPRTRNVLTNDIGTDLRISSADADFGEALAHPLMAVRCAMPRPWTASWVMTRSPTGSVPPPTPPPRFATPRSGSCATCSAGATTCGSRASTSAANLVTATGDIRVCSDGTNIETDSVHLSTDTTKRMIGARALNKLVGAAIKALTRGVVNYKLDLAWDEQSTSTKLAARFRSCRPCRSARASCSGKSMRPR